VPIEQRVGSRLRIGCVVVTDVFGDRLLVPAAKADPPWTLFTASVDGTAAPAAGLLLPPTAGAAIQPGDALEDVRFLRDEGANLLWAPWSGLSRAAAAIRRLRPNGLARRRCRLGPSHRLASAIKFSPMSRGTGFPSCPSH